jgi:hypothetical protein
MLVPIHQATWCHDPQDSDLHSHGCENLKSGNFRVTCIIQDGSGLLSS